MDIQTLNQDISLVNGQFTLNAKTIPGLLVQPLLSAYNGNQPLIISNAQKTVTANSVIVKGIIPFLRVPTLPVEALFQLDGTGTPVATLHFTLIGKVPPPNAWRFSTSFPNMPLFLDYGKSVATPQLNLLDTLQLSNAFFVLTTQAGKDQATGVPLTVGLNFIGMLKLVGLAGLFDTLLGAHAQATLYGTILIPTPNQVTPPLPYQTYPWQAQWSVPGIQLQVDLGIVTTLSKLKYSNTMLHIYSPPDNAWLSTNESYQTTLAVTGTLQVASANITANTVVELTPGYPSVSIIALFQNTSLDDLSHLADLANGKDLLAALPPDVQQQLPKIGKLSLERASINLTNSFSAAAVASVSLTIGLPNLQWTVFSGITVKNIFVDFIINNPFSAHSRSVSALVGGTIDIGGTLLDVTTQFPDFTLWVELQDDASLPLQALFKQYVPELPAPPDLVVSEALLVITPGQEYSFTAMLADDPAWTLNLGSTPLIIDDVRIELSKQASTTPQATFDGRLQLTQDLILTLNYSVPGDFFLRADLPTVTLSALIKRFDETNLSLPTGFDITFAQSFVLIERTATDLSFSVATSIPNLGLLAFTVQHQSTWGFALGLDLSTGGLASLPGLSILAPFDAFVGLQTVMLVVSSLSQSTGFQFPDFANFNAPSLGNNTIRLPAQASGLVRGLNFYALLNTSNSQGFQALAKYLGIQLNGTIGITVAISLPDPATNSRLFLSINEEIQKGTTLVGELGGLLQGSDVGAFVTAIVKTQVQGQPLEFDVTAAVLDDGVLISGTLQGTLSFDVVQLSNLALVIGLDFEGIPSLGIAATLDISNFDTALAVFFDSADPAKSLVAGAISNVTLLDIVQSLAGQQNIPSVLRPVFGLIGLKALNAFTLPASVTTALDNRNLSAIADAFKQYGTLTIPASSDQILLVITTKSSVWHLTDLSTMQHYSLTLQGTSIAVTLQPQFYLAPQTTFIGSLQYPQGFTIIAEIDYLLIQARIKILINTTQGIAADVDLAQIVLLNRDFFSITGVNGQGGPHLSLATYSQPGLSDAQLRDPHFLLSGNIRLLGVDMAAIYVLISEHGLTFTITSQINPLLHVDLNGTFTSLTNINVSGTILVGINRQLDLGTLGALQINVTIGGTLAVSYTGGSPTATFQGGFVFQSIQCNIPSLALNANSPALQNIADTLWSQIQDIIAKLLKSADQWLSWVKNGVIQGAGQTANQVGQVLSSVYHLSANDIASKTKQIMGYGITGITHALQGAGATANEAVSALKSVGYEAADISSAIASVFTNTHADINVGHIDTAAGPHVDTPTSHVDAPGTHADTTSHTDIPGSHIDTSSHVDIPRVHTDSNTFFGHADTTFTPHGDSNPHVDQTTTPHGDSNPHVDQALTPHGDTMTPHADQQVPPHGDTSSHVDVKS